MEKTTYERGERIPAKLTGSSVATTIGSSSSLPISSHRSQEINPSCPSEQEHEAEEALADVVALRLRRDADVRTIDDRRRTTGGLSQSRRVPLAFGARRERPRHGRRRSDRVATRGRRRTNRGSRGDVGAHRARTRHNDSPRGTAQGLVDARALLIHQGANVDAVDGFGDTALRWAADSGRTRMRDLLMDRVNAR